MYEILKMTFAFFIKLNEENFEKQLLCSVQKYGVVGIIEDTGKEVSIYNINAHVYCL